MESINATPPGKPVGVFKKTYHWVLGWANHRYALWALFALAFAESSFFPVPPDVLIIALAMGKPEGAWKYAAIGTAGSVAGGIFGYWLGFEFFEAIGRPIIEALGREEAFSTMQAILSDYSFIAILGAALTPIPYKVFTISAGLAQVPLMEFIVASILGRGLRFFVVAGIVKKFGPTANEYIEKHFAKMTIIGFILLAILFLVYKRVFH